MLGQRMLTTKANRYVVQKRIEQGGPFFYWARVRGFPRIGQAMAFVLRRHQDGETYRIRDLRDKSC